MSVEISVGCLVVNPKRPKWGPGKVVKLEADRAYVIWRDVDLQPKAMLPSALVLARQQDDPFFDRLSVKKASSKSRASKKRVPSYEMKEPIVRRDFVGFSEADFLELAGSSWRGRHSLGGLLAATLRSTLKRPYKSWGVRRRLELHIANENHYSTLDPFPFPKLFVYSKDELAFGFYIEAPLNPSHEDFPKHTYWRAFRKKLIQNQTVSEVLLKTMEKHQLTLGDYYREEGGVLGGNFKVRDGSILFESPSDTKTMKNDEFIHRITEPNSSEWMDLHLFSVLEKSIALDLKGGVATPILSVLQDLAPLYEVSIAVED